MKPKSRFIVGTFLDASGRQIKQEILSPVSDMTRYLPGRSGVACFPLHAYNPELSWWENQTRLRQLISDGAVSPFFAWLLPREELLFGRFQIQFSKAETPCVHFLTGAQLECGECGSFVGCRYCHEEQTTDFHSFSYSGRVRCVACGGLETQSLEFSGERRCGGCGAALWRYCCGKCGFSSLNNPGCARTSQTAPPEIPEDMCCVCQGEFDSCLLEPRFMSCGHAVHYACFQQVARRCPACTTQGVRLVETAAEAALATALRNDVDILGALREVYSRFLTRRDEMKTAGDPGNEEIPCNVIPEKQEKTAAAWLQTDTVEPGIAGPGLRMALDSPGAARMDARQFRLFAAQCIKTVRGLRAGRGFEMQ